MYLGLSINLLNAIKIYFKFNFHDTAEVKLDIVLLIMNEDDVLDYRITVNKA